jgi:hypothetical protein
MGNFTVSSDLSTTILEESDEDGSCPFSCATLAPADLLVLMT